MEHVFAEAHCDSGEQILLTFGFMIDSLTTKKKYYSFGNAACRKHFCILCPKPRQSSKLWGRATVPAWR